MAVADLAQLERSGVQAGASSSERPASAKDASPQPLANQPLPGKPSLASSRLKLTGESLADLLSALKISAEELERAAIGTPFTPPSAQQPSCALLSAPAEIVTAPAPPAAQWMRSQKPQFTRDSAGDMRARGCDRRATGAAARRSQPSAAASQLRSAEFELAGQSQARHALLADQLAAGHHRSFWAWSVCSSI